MLRRLSLSDSNFATDFAELIARSSLPSSQVDDAVRKIINDVRANGDKALRKYARRFDATDLDVVPLRVCESYIKSAGEALAVEDREALELARTRIASYHEKLKPQDFETTDAEGVRLGARWTPISKVGLYVPGGSAAYPSSFLMNAVPAQMAGVERIVVATPAKEGVINPLILALADMLGLYEIYCIGGAHAIAALAYGSETIAAVDKITGPGNAYVAAAKRQVFGQVGIDMIAGPSEVLVVADADNDPSWLAADLLSQAEHDPAAQAILITDSPPLADAVTTQITAIMDKLPRADIARQSLQNHGGIINVTDLQKQAPALIDAIAPEHLQLNLNQADALISKIHHAAAIFIGNRTPEAIGDYIAGPNHILPTSGTARFAESLATTDFLKRTSIIDCSKANLQQIATAAKHLAEREGLQAHALSLQMRLDAKQKPNTSPPHPPHPPQPKHFNEGTDYIAEITLDETTVTKRTPEIEHEKKVAIFDLIQKNSFILADKTTTGPYKLHIAAEEGKRLVITIDNTQNDENIRNIILALSSFRKLIRDYFQICESYFDGIKHLSPTQIETIDMARRGLHNEGAELLRTRLDGKIKTDMHTARRLFTLICALHIKI